MIDEDADGAGHQGEDERFHDAAVRDGVLQSGEPLAEDVEQQRHHAQGCYAGARRHDDTGSGERRSVTDPTSIGRWSWAVHLRFMSPLKAREKMLDNVPPGQQPQMSTVTALMASICRNLARPKAVRGMMPNWATRAMATPFGFRRWALILESSMVQPREIMVMKRMVTVKMSMVLFRVGEIFRTKALPLLEKFPPLKMGNEPKTSEVFILVPSHKNYSKRRRGFFFSKQIKGIKTCFVVAKEKSNQKVMQ